MGEVTMRKVTIAIICVAAFTATSISCFFWGRKNGVTEYYTLNTPSYLLLMMDIRDRMAKIPEEVRQDYQINIKKFDVLLWGLVTNYDIKQNEIEKAFLKHGNSIRSLEKLREKVEEARTITKDLAILSVPVVREKR